jgi:hypothetical protein
VVASHREDPPVQMMYRIARPALRKAIATSSSIRTYVAPINDLNFLIKDVFKFSEHYKKLGYDVEVLSYSSIEI